MSEPVPRSVVLLVDDEAEVRRSLSLVLEPRRPRRGGMHNDSELHAPGAARLQQ